MGGALRVASASNVETVAGKDMLLSAQDVSVSAARSVDVSASEAARLASIRAERVKLDADQRELANRRVRGVPNAARNLCRPWPLLLSRRRLCPAPRATAANPCPVHCMHAR